jgi:cell division protein FtsZ
MGYDDTLGDKLGITLIATGFEHKMIPQPTVTRAKVRRKRIVMVLGQPEISPVAEVVAPVVAEEVVNTPTEEVAAPVAPELNASVESLTMDPLMPTLVETQPEPVVELIKETEATFLAAAVIMPEPVAEAVASGGVSCKAC